MNSEAQYPYTAKDGACNQKLDGVLTVDTIHDVPENSVAQLKAAVAQQPISVLVEADHPIFHQYKSGIINSPDCGTTLDHAVLAVGYGSENGLDYFLVRNSWTAAWGEKGYVRIAAVDGPGICGIQKVSVYADTS
jgi:C1A family cysteine protease